MMMGAMILRPEHVGRFVDGQISEDGRTLTTGHDQSVLRIGYAYPVSVHLVRAVEYRNPLPFAEGSPLHAEACRVHFGRYALWADGYSHVFTCDGPREEDSQWSAVAQAQTFIHDAAQQWEADLPLVPGYTYHLTSYQTPLWREAAYWSFEALCAGAPI